jgi:hypothetical protein
MGNSCPYCKAPYPIEGYPEFPNYHGSLDAMAVAEAHLLKISNPILSSPQPSRCYLWKLAEIVCGEKLWDNGTFIGIPHDVVIVALGTPEQRAEAYLRTLNLWKE